MENDHQGQDKVDQVYRISNSMVIEKSTIALFLQNLSSWLSSEYDDPADLDI